MKRGSGTVICASKDQKTCSGETDLDQNSTLDGNSSCGSLADYLSKEYIMRINTALDSVTITGSDDRVFSRPDGRITIPNKQNTKSASFTLKADGCEYQQQRLIGLTGSGHVSSKEQDCS